MEALFAASIFFAFFADYLLVIPYRFPCFY